VSNNRIIFSDAVKTADKRLVRFSNEINYDKKGLHGKESSLVYERVDVFKNCETLLFLNCCDPLVVLFSIDFGYQ